MKNLIEKIDRIIEDEIMKTGKMGTETVTVKIILTDEERDLFRNIEKYDDEHYFYEFDKNEFGEKELWISYTEDV